MEKVRRAREGEDTTRTCAALGSPLLGPEEAIAIALVNEGLSEVEVAILVKLAHDLDRATIESLLARASETWWGVHAELSIQAMHEPGQLEARVAEVEAIARAVSLQEVTPWPPPVAKTTGAIAALAGALKHLLRGEKPKPTPLGRDAMAGIREAEAELDRLARFDATAAVRGAFTASENAESRAPAKPEPAPTIEELDARILDVLRAAGSGVILSAASVEKRLRATGKNLDVNNLKRRMKRLKDRGILTGTPRGYALP